MSEFRIEPYREERHATLAEELTRLLHSAYAPLAKEGMHYLASRQSVSVTLDRLREGEAYLFFLHEQLVGTVSLYEGISKRVSADYYRQPGVYLFGQFAVSPSLQGRGFGSRVMDFLEARAREKGARELALDTAEQASKLIHMYEKRGYRIVSSTQWPDVSYRSLILTKDL